MVTSITELEKRFLVFEINEDLEDFQKLDIEEGPMYNILKPDSIFLFLDEHNKQIWLWHGRHAEIRKKFIATQSAPKIRDQYGIDYKITAVDDGKEDIMFKVFLGLE
ncbi:MAG: hypothetical protein ACFFFB_16690 [Candidatus Heimdallarchaeota archaeon]